MPSCSILHVRLGLGHTVLMGFTIILSCRYNIIIVYALLRRTAVYLNRLTGEGVLWGGGGSEKRIILCTRLKYSLTVLNARVCSVYKYL